MVVLRLLVVPHAGSAATLVGLLADTALDTVHLGGGTPRQIALRCMTGGFLFMMMWQHWFVASRGWDGLRADWPSVETSGAFLYTGNRQRLSFRRRAEMLRGHSRKGVALRLVSTDAAV